ncbi:hypothetical protein KVV02_002921 [Mortierella alpina]|uniref:Rhomboid-type serine protease n=1 Tax=Mortierella alpina TaxID=64518 RepID=A0A9P8CW30_MORAP|nr:hypothetical protein KVV02_002921 [Mortierella alpina]
MSYSQPTSNNNNSGFKHEWHDDDRQTPIEGSSMHNGQQERRQDSYNSSFATGVAGTASPSHSYSNQSHSHNGLEREDQEQYPVGRPLSYFPTHHQPLSQQEYDEEQHQRTEHYHQMAPLQHAHSPLSSRTPDWGGGGYSGYQPQSGAPPTPDIPLVGIDIVSSNLEATRNGTQFSDTRTAENMAGPAMPHDSSSVYSSGAGVGSGANHLQDKNMDSSNANYQYGQAQQAPPPPPPAAGPSGGYAGQPVDAETGEPIPKVLLDPKVQHQLNKRKVWRPWFIWIVSAVQIAMLVFEFAKGYQRTNQIVQTNPFNPMIGPGTGTIIVVGARFVPCMRDTYLTNQTIKCPDNTALDCTLSDICGFTPIASTGKAPDQWFRFITPIFLHGGIVHLLFNLMFQLRTGADLERDMGWWRIGIIYMTSGIVGFIFGGNFAPLLSRKSSSMGASGAIFGLIGCLVLDLIQNWSLVVRPCWELSKLSLMILFSFAFGLLPFLDNFAHIGGFFAGILTGLVFMPVVYFSKRDKLIKLGLRVAALPLIVLIIVLGLTNFYKGTSCSWCRYLSCLPINGWCDAFNPPAGAPTGN